MVTLVIIITAFPLTVSNADDTTSTDYVIFAADPTKLGASGTTATPSDLSDTTWYDNGGLITTMYTDTDGETAKYKWSHSFSEADKLYYPRSVVDMGYSSEDIPWIADQTVLTALAGKITVSVTAYADGALTASNNNTGISIYPIDKTYARSEVWASTVKMGDLGKGTQTTFTQKPEAAFKSFASGYLAITTTIKATTANGEINWEIYDIRFTVNSDDKTAINEALAAAGSDWTFESMVAAYENRDYESVDEVIFAADPSKLGESGTTATPSDLSDTSLYTNGTLITTAYTNTETGAAKYAWTQTFGTTNSLYYPRTAIDMGYSSEDIPWIADADVLNALAGKITISMKAYASGGLNASGNDTTISVFPIDKTTSRYSDGKTDPWTLKTEMGKVGKDTEVEFAQTPTVAFTPFASGYLFITTTVKAMTTDPITWEIYDIQFTINSDDKTAIDEALAAANSEWTYDSLVQTYKNAVNGISPNTTYVIWDADPDKYDLLAGTSATATFATSISSPVDVYKGYGDKSAYFTSAIDFTGKSSSGSADYAVVNGYDNTDYTYGWTNIAEIMDVIDEYMYSSVDYRVSGDSLPTSCNIYFGLSGKYDVSLGSKNGVLAVIQSSVPSYGTWNTIPYTLIKQPEDAEPFGWYWYYSQWRYHLYATNGNFNGVTNIDVRGFRLALKEKDRLAINEKLKDIANTVESAKMTNFLSGATVGIDINGNPDYFELLIRHDAVSSWGHQAENEPSVILKGSSTDRTCEMSMENTRYAAGDTVKVKTSVNAGDVIDALVVLDAEENPVTVTKTAPNTYTFIMPDSDVTVSASVAPPPADGDMNDDGKIDILDAVILATKLKVSAEITDEAVVAVADISGDGKVTAADLNLIRKTRLNRLGAPYEYVVVIGVDGAGAYFKDAETPNIDKIFENGAMTYRMLTENPTISAQCWASLMHGVTADVHGLTNSIVDYNPYPDDSPYPSFFRVIRENDASAKLASFSHWNSINIGIVEDGINVHKVGGLSDSILTDAICNYVAENNPTAMYVQFDEADGVGHSTGFGTQAQLDKIAEIDGYIGRIYEAYKQKGILDETLFIVTADHGGNGTSHGGLTDEEKYVMFAAAGRTVEIGGEITDMEIRDTAAVVLYALDYDAPETWTARVPSGLFKGVTAGERPVN